MAKSGNGKNWQRREAVRSVGLGKIWQRWQGAGARLGVGKYWQGKQGGRASVRLANLGRVCARCSVGGCAPLSVAAGGGQGLARSRSGLSRSPMAGAVAVTPRGAWLGGAAWLDGARGKSKSCLLGKNCHPSPIRARGVGGGCYPTIPIHENFFKNACRTHIDRCGHIGYGIIPIIGEYGIFFFKSP